ncbi:MAG: hypothetical protein ACFWUC_13860 [Oscillospiraceae bacterium]|jgi:hypothetical protein
MNDTDMQSTDTLLRLINNLAFMDDQEWEKDGASVLAQSFSDYYASGGFNKYSVTYRWVHITNPENYEYLLFRIKSVGKVLKQNNSVYLRDFEKLIDYINLEISRARNVKEIADQARNTKLSLEEIKELASNIKNDEKKQKEDLQNTKMALNTQSITVLSIFSAIVISFFGGINFIGNAISSAYQTQIFKVIMIILIAGLVLFNVIFLLLYMVSRIIEKNIYAKCKTDDCSCDPRCCGFNRFRHRLPYVFWINIFLVVLTVIDAIVWHFCGYVCF